MDFLLLPLPVEVLLPVVRPQSLRPKADDPQVVDPDLLEGEVHLQVQHYFVADGQLGPAVLHGLLLGPGPAVLLLSAEALGVFQGFLELAGGRVEFNLYFSAFLFLPHLFEPEVELPFEEVRVDDGPFGGNLDFLVANVGRSRMRLGFNSAPSFLFEVLLMLLWAVLFGEKSRRTLPEVGDHVDRSLELLRVLHEFFPRDLLLVGNR